MNMQDLILKTGLEFFELAVIIKIGEEENGIFKELEEKQIWYTTNNVEKAFKHLKILNKHFPNYGFLINIYKNESYFHDLNNKKGG